MPPRSVICSSPVSRWFVPRRDGFDGADRRGAPLTDTTNNAACNSSSPESTHADPPVQPTPTDGKPSRASARFLVGVLFLGVGGAAVLALYLAWPKDYSCAGISLGMSLTEAKSALPSPPAREYSWFASMNVLEWRDGGAPQPWESLKVSFVGGRASRIEGSIENRSEWLSIQGDFLKRYGEPQGKVSSYGANLWYWGNVSVSDPLVPSFTAKGKIVVLCCFESEKGCWVRFIVADQDVLPSKSDP